MTEESELPGPAWCLVQYRRPGEYDERTGVLVDGKVVALPEALTASTLMSLIADWDATAAALTGWSPDMASVVDGAHVIAPLTYPGKVLCAGANYYSHTQEMGVATPDPESDPFFFLKPPVTTVIGPTDDIPYPSYQGVKLDWEAELGVVIGHRIRDVAPSDARQHIAGYLAANDVSARDRTARAEAVSPHFVYDWLGHKGQDGFCPVGPGIVPVWQVPDPQQLRIRLSINGVVKQDSSTADMVITIDRLVAAASRLMTLEPGDVILTGTPAGVGVPRGEFMTPGDVCVIEIEGVGRLENEVRSR